MNPHNRSEKGQAIVFLVLGFVVFLGFVALAVDGGMLYSNRRNTQNASDASSLSGGGAAALSLANSAAAGEDGAIYTEWDCSSSEVWQAKNLAINSAIARAGSNNFTITGDPNDVNPSDPNTATTICGVDSNPSFDDKYIDVYTVISETTKASFAQLLFPGSLTNIVTATTRVRPMMPFVFGEAIVALRDYCPPGGGTLEFKGGSGAGTDVWVHGGGIFSNSCIKATGGAEVEVLPAGRYDNTCLGNGCYVESGGSVSPTPQQGGPELPPYSYSLDAPDCNQPGMVDHGSFNGNGTITVQPGRYTNFKVTNSADVTMDPGLYCIMGSGDMSVNGGLLKGEDGVTIYFENGSYTSGGQADIRLNACMSNNCPGYALKKVLFYAAEGDVYMSGGSNSTYTGLVYAPKGLLDLGGSGSGVGEVHVQLVGWEVKIHGDAELNIYYDDIMQIWKSAQIELYK